MDEYWAWQITVLLIGLARLLELEENADVRAAYGSGCRQCWTSAATRDGT